MHVLKDRSFLIAIVLLVLASIGLPLSQRVIAAMAKRPVPWPAHVVVDDHFRNTGFPVTIGPYSRVEEDGVFFRNREGVPIKDGLPDGECIYCNDELPFLGIVPREDRILLQQRAGNWYFSRTYRDCRDGKYWKLDVTYFTGDLDRSPKLPCTGGATGSVIENAGESDTIEVPGAPAEWVKIRFRRIVYTNATHRRMQYYVFSCSGEPDASRASVRSRLNAPLQTYVYFAKIQFEPVSRIVGEDAMDRQIQEFIKTCLPVILKDLPSRSDVQKLEAAKPWW